MSSGEGNEESVKRTGNSLHRFFKHKGKVIDDKKELSVIFIVIGSAIKKLKL